jgi:hypothetical protein
MSSNSPPPNSPFDGEPSSEEALANALRSVRALAGRGFTVVGPLGRDLEGTFAFLARDLSANRLVVLKGARASVESGAPGILTVISQLDDSVPPPAGACSVCQTPIAGWDPACPECGADLAGSNATANQDLSPEELLSVVREAAQGYEVLGQMPRAGGGAPVYFGCELQGGNIVALRLDPENSPGRRSGFTVAATRMMRPRLLYGSIGSAPRESGGDSLGAVPWASTPSPQPSLRPIGTSRPGASSPFDRHGTPGKTCPQCHKAFGPGSSQTSSWGLSSPIGITYWPSWVRAGWAEYISPSTFGWVDAPQSR